MSLRADVVPGAGVKGHVPTAPLGTYMHEDGDGLGPPLLHDLFQA